MRNVSVGAIVVTTAPLHCDVPGDAVRASLRTQRFEEEKIVATTVPLVRVAAVPSAHPYVTAVADPAGVRLLADPPPPGVPAGQWWPPQVLLPEWLEAHAAEFDLVHVHFGIESYTADELALTVAALERLGKPLVYTVHDLENPQLSSQDAHRAGLAVLAHAADELITLTASAADEVAAITGRTATVVAHPTLLGRRSDRRAPPTTPCASASICETSGPTSTASRPRRHSCARSRTCGRRARGSKASSA